MKNKFLLKPYKNAIKAMNEIMEACNANYMHCDCYFMWIDGNGERCVLDCIPCEWELDDSIQDKCIQSAIELSNFCKSSSGCHSCVFGIQDECIIKGCPAIWEKRLEYLRTKMKEK